MWPDELMEKQAGGSPSWLPRPEEGHYYSNAKTKYHLQQRTIGGRSRFRTYGLSLVRRVLYH